MTIDAGASSAHFFSRLSVIQVGASKLRTVPVAVEIVGYGEAERGALRNSPVAPLADSEHATAAPDYFVDLTPIDDLDQNPV